MSQVKDFQVPIKPNWCPGCGDFAVLAGLQRALANLNIEPHETVVVGGIGCSGRIAGYLNCYGFHSLHGRALPVAQGIKLANPNLCVIAAGGDGDGFGIGLNHFMHAVRRNVNITYVTMDNQIYGLTKGQTSPTSPLNFKTRSSPAGNREEPINPLAAALSAGAGFVAQAFSGNMKELVDILEQAIRHQGFSFVNVLSPCVTFNQLFTYDFYRENLVHVKSGDPDYDETDKAAAFLKIIETEGLCTGLIYRRERPSLDEQVLPGNQAIAEQELKVDREKIESLLRKFAS